MEGKARSAGGKLSMSCREETVTEGEKEKGRNRERQLKEENKNKNGHKK